MVLPHALVTSAMNGGKRMNPHQIAESIVKDWEQERNCPDGHKICDTSCLVTRLEAALIAWGGLHGISQTVL